MESTPFGWNVFDAATPILTYTYSFGPGVATSLAVGSERGLVVLSPPYRVAPGVYEDLLPYGAVRMLIASNAFHHMGLPEWKRVFPDAAVFAPAQAVRRVERRSGLEVRPLAEAAAMSGPRLELIDLPYYRTGEVLVRIRTARGLVWYVTDIILNLPELPRQPVVKALFKLSGSAPGLRFNNLAPLFMVKNRKALRHWLSAEYAKAPPRWLIPTHGEIVDFVLNPQAALRLFEPG